MAHFKLACLSILCFALLLPTLAHGTIDGSNYTTSASTPSLSDGTQNCIVGKSQCWISISSTPTIQQLSIGVDGTPYGLDASGNLWTLPFRSHTWQSSALSPMTELSVNSGQDIYGLQFDATFCGAPEKRIYHYTGGTDFAKLSYCALHIASAADGTLYRIRSSGNVSHLIDNNGTWVTDTSAGGNGTPLKISAGTAKNVWLITSTGVIKMLNASGVFVVVPGFATDIATTGNVGAAVTWIVGTTANANNVYQYNYGSSNWKAMIGVLKNISTGGAYYTMGLGTLSVFHFNATVFTITGRMSGSFDCNVFPNGCPQGAMHTAKVTVSWLAGGIIPQSGTVVGTPSQFLNAAISSSTQNCDPVFGDPSDPVCQVQISGVVLCSAMGAIESVGFKDLVGFAQTLFAVAGPQTDCVTTILGTTTCTWPVVPNCINTPVFVTNFVDDSPPALKAWWVDGACVRATVNSPWHCEPVPLTALKTPQVQPGFCKNPD